MNKVIIWPTIFREIILSALDALDCVQYEEVNSINQLELALPGASGLVLTNSTYTEAVSNCIFENRHSLRLLQLLTTGYENVLAYGVPPEVCVANVGHAWSSAVSEHVMALMLSMTKFIPTMVLNQKEHRWDKAIGSSMGTLEGATLVIVGFGGIGRDVARRARAFGMHIVGVTRSGASDPQADEMFSAAYLSEALMRADVLLIAVPSSPETRGMIGRSELEALPQHARLINVARGDIVDTAALESALCSGTIAGAALDVTDPEPLGKDSILWDLPNVLITPHIAGSCGPKGEERVVAVVIDNLKRYVSGSELLNCIKPAV